MKLIIGHIAVKQMEIFSWKVYLAQDSDAWFEVE